MEVVTVGAMAVDYFALLPSIPAADEKIIADKHEVHPGGVAGNVATQLARLNVHAGWFGKIGHDDTGRIILDDFKKERIDASHVEVVEGEQSMFTWIQVNAQGERSITMFPNVLVKLTSDDVSHKHAGYI